MKVAISSGHGKYVRGASGYIDEVDEARLVVEEVARMLRTVNVPTQTFHDNTSHSQSENLNRIVNWHNEQTRELDVSVHFNAYETTSKPMGCEVLYVSSSGMDYADHIVDSICNASALINRGPKKRTDLAFLNGTHETAVLIETCFCDSKADVDIYHNLYNEICIAITEAISNQRVEAPPPDERPPVERPPDVPPPGPMSPPTLGKGDSGNDVVDLQNSMGVLIADGEFGEITETQVQAFQAACGIGADGVVGPITWEEVDDLNSRVRASNYELSESLRKQVVALAKASPLQNYSWRDRGQTPPGYLPGMALCFAEELLHKESDAYDIMSMSDQDEPDTDALSWYRSEFAALGMNNSRNGVETLRHLFVLMIGLGPRESSGIYCEGRDMSADNVESDTAEAGLFQTSWNISTVDDAIGELLTHFYESPTGFLEEFQEDISPSASNLDTYGSGNGAKYQWLSRFAPAFHVLVTGVGLRLRRQHWGPINRKEVELKREADELLKRVGELVGSGGAVV